MKKYQQWLLSLLVAQCVVCALVFWLGSTSKALPAAEPLMSVRSSAVDKWVIADGAQQVEIKKNGSDWLLPNLHQLPADKQKVEELFSKIDALDLRWPIATTTSSHERFEVTDKKFQRKIEYSAGDKKLGEFYLGTSPGFKQVHVRSSHSDKVFAAELSQFDFSVNPNDWLSKTLVATRGITGIKTKDYELTKEGADWVFANDKTKADTSKVASLVAAIETLQVVELMTSAPPQGNWISVTVNGDAGRVEYQFMQVDNNAYLKRGDRDFVFKIAVADYEKVVKPSASDLAQAVGTPSAANPVAIPDAMSLLKMGTEQKNVPPKTIVPSASSQPTATQK